ncbi:hypothetical protein GF327_00995 [Candidatus Woesearchaeota archaeon]|nr:hypothetical protein [Candidatus Woesearchaeota archaeon]
MKYKIFLFSILFIFVCSFSVNAVIIGVSPSILKFNKMIKQGYAEKTITVSTSSREILSGHFEVEGDVSDWIFFRPNSTQFNVSSDNPYRVSLIIRPGRDTKNGNYSGIVRILTDNVAKVEKGAGSSVIAAVALRVYIEVIGEEIIECRAGAFSVPNIEVGLPIQIMSNVYNDGNVRLKPEFKIEIYDKFRENILLKKSLIGQEILPTLYDRIFLEIDNELSPGQYFINVLIKECAVSRLLTFDVLEKGGIVDEGNFVGIRTKKISYVGEPTPILPVFKNVGPRRVFAKFKGEIRSLETDRIIEVIESDEIVLESGKQVEFPLFFVPKDTGTYQISGRVIYNNKITIEEKSKTIKAVKSKQKFKMNIFFLMLIYLIIGLTILILIGKIKKEKRKY